jgi:heptosyltransferase III
LTFAVYFVFSKETIASSCGAPQFSTETTGHDNFTESPFPQSFYGQLWREVRALRQEARPCEDSILVIRTGALGDTILTFPVLASIRAAHLGEAVVFLGNSAYSELIPEGIEFHPIDAPEWSWLFHADSDRAPERPRTFRKAYVILNRPDDVIRNLARTGVRELIHAPSLPPQGKHIVDHLHEALGLKIPARRAVFETMRQAEERLIWLHPGSGGPRKCVPLRAIVQIAKKLRAATKFELVVTAGEEDEFLKTEAAWGELMSQPGVTLVQNTPLSELVSRLSRAAIFIGNDSGISHLAANLGVKSVVFFVASDPIQWAPWVPEQGVNIIDLTHQDLSRNEWIEIGLANALDFLTNCIPS